MLNTLLSIIELSCLYFPLVLGAYISMSLMKVPDLSIESAYAVGAIFATKFLLAHDFPQGLQLLFVIIVSLLGGLCVGIISSSMTRFAKIPHLLSSILTIGLFHGIKQFLMGVSNLSVSGSANPLASVPIINQRPELFMLMLLLCVLAILGFLFLKTQLGYAVAVYGNNPRFFENYGMSTTYVFCSGIMLANALAGLSGYLVVQSSGFVDINAEIGMALFCVTALILGKTVTFSQRFFSLWVPMVGVFSYCCLQQLLLKIGFNLKYFTMIQSAVVLILLIYRYRIKHTGELKPDNLGV